MIIGGSLSSPGACHGVLEETVPLRGRAVQDDSRGPQGEAGVFLRECGDGWGREMVKIERGIIKKR